MLCIFVDNYCCEYDNCGLCFARGAVSAQKLRPGATRPTGQGRTLLFPILFVAQVPA